MEGVAAGGELIARNLRRFPTSRQLPLIRHLAWTPLMRGGNPPETLEPRPKLIFH